MLARDKIVSHHAQLNFHHGGGDRRVFFLFIDDDARRRQREEKRTKSETPTVLRRPHRVQQFDVFALERRFQARAEIVEVEN